jgi:peptide/nickel transport system substrate-binding protein
MRTRFVVAAVVLVTLAAGCSGSQKAATPTTATRETPARGGTLVVGASQEPNCADWYAACGNSSWGRDMMGYQTLPRAFDFVDGQYRPSPLLAGQPVLESSPRQRVTYRLNPQAVWSDGQPITSSDLRYTAEVAKATAFNATAGAVDTVDDSDPRTAVVTFTDPTPAWRDNFAFVLPKHLLAGKDRSSEMGNGYSFSGGPWVLDHWTKGQEIKLVPNPAYWGAKPNLDAVVFKVITDSSAYLAAYKTGQLDMAFVQGAQPEVAELKQLPDTHFEVSTGLTYEFAMFNVEKPSLDRVAVRQALAYAADRDAIVTQLSGPLQPGIKPAQAFMSPGNQQWYTEPFKKYGRDLAKVNQLMTADGWAKGSDGIWAKAGARASVELNTMTGNRRRELAEQILQSQWKEAGFDVPVNNTTSTALLGDWLPKGTFQAAIYGLAPATPDPNLCTTFCSRFVPTEANGLKGNNVSRISSKTLDDTWQTVATELDDAKRLDAVRRAQQALADEVPGLPLGAVLDIVVYNSAKVGGVKTSATRAFSNLSEWSCRAPSCQH